MSRHRFGAAWMLGLALVVLAGIVPVGAAAPVQVSEGPDLSWASTGAAAGTGASLYVAYVAPADAGFGPVRVSRSKDGGATFLPSILVSDVGTTDNQTASVAAAGSSVHVLWIVGSGAAERAWLRTSRDGGATWSPSVPVTPPGMSLGEPGVFASGERVFITYTDLVTDRMLLRRSTDRGGTFAPPLDIGASRVAVRATMAFSTGVMYIAWAGTEGKVRVRRSTTGGTTWNSSVAMQTPPDGGTSSTEPWLATAGHNVMLVGRSAYLIFSWASADDGRHWGSARDVSGSRHPLAVSPMLIRSAGRWIVTYRACGSEGVNGCELIAIYVRTSLDGRQWTSPQQLSGAGVAHNAGIARTSSNHLAWSIFDWESFDAAAEPHVFARSR